MQIPGHSQPWSEGNHDIRGVTQRQKTLRFQFSPKARRVWPRRKPHEPPKPPILLTLTDEQKALLDQHLGAA